MSCSPKYPNFVRFPLTVIKLYTHISHFIFILYTPNHLNSKSLAKNPTPREKEREREREKEREKKKVGECQHEAVFSPPERRRAEGGLEECR